MKIIRKRHSKSTFAKNQGILTPSLSPLFTFIRFNRPPLSQGRTYGFPRRALKPLLGLGHPFSRVIFLTLNESFAQVNENFVQVCQNYDVRKNISVHTKCFLCATKYLWNKCQILRVHNLKNWLLQIYNGLYKMLSQNT